MPEDQDNNRKDDLTNVSNEKNIIHPTTVDHLLEHICQMVEEKNAANVAAALVSCSQERRSSTTTTQFKPINVYTLEAPTTSAPKVTPPVSESSSSTLLTLDQVNQLWNDRESKVVWEGCYYYAP